MSVTEIKRLPLLELFQLLEALWEDLSERIVDMPVSKGDREFLGSRLERLASSEAKVFDWNDVKYKIGKKL